MEQKKYAVFTMDVESFADTECISASSIRVDVDLMDGLDEYIRILDRHNIKSTLFTVGNLASKIADRLQPHICNGHTLALHNYEHVTPMSVSLERFKEENSVLIHPGVSKMSVQKGMVKIFGSQKWIEIIESLLQHQKRVFLAGGPDDDVVVSEIMNGISPNLKSRLIN